jgi:hypothetical protein
VLHPFFESQHSGVAGNQAHPAVWLGDTYPMHILVVKSVGDNKACIGSQANRDVCGAQMQRLYSVDVTIP